MGGTCDTNVRHRDTFLELPAEARPGPTVVDPASEPRALGGPLPLGQPKAAHVGIRSPPGVPGRIRLRWKPSGADSTDWQRCSRAHGCRHDRSNICDAELRLCTGGLSVKAVSLFAGAGGLDEGVRRAGFDVVLA